MNFNHKDTLRILYIEDDNNDIDILNYELGKVYRIIWSRVETEASLISVLDHGWDIILCDYNMPHLSAERAYLTASRNNMLEIPFIIVSGVVDEDNAVELMKKGITDFVRKDDIKRLLFTIQREVRNYKKRSNEALRTDIRIRESYDMTIEAWGKALELRDLHTQGHTLRTTDMCLRLAKQIGVDHSEFQCLKRGALLHDIGKMAIPDAILLKPDILTEDEMKIMRMHPKLAFEMLNNIPFLRPCIAVPYSHHERWNGTGYPQGLKGEDIPFMARLFAIVDVYDALTSTRPYRKPWAKDEVLSYLSSEKGKLFDEELVNSFIDMINKG